MCFVNISLTSCCWIFWRWTCSDVRFSLHTQASDTFSYKTHDIWFLKQMDRVLHQSPSEWGFSFRTSFNMWHTSRNAYTFSSVLRGWVNQVVRWRGFKDAPNSDNILKWHEGQSQINETTSNPNFKSFLSKSWLSLLSLHRLAHQQENMHRKLPKHCWLPLTET